MWRVVRAAARLVHCWWHGDRVRASPREGKLLRLAPPCFVRLAGEPAAVVRRRVVTGAVVYSCDAAAGPYELVVRPTGGEPAVAVRRAGAEWAVAADEVEVIPGPAGDGRSGTTADAQA